MSDPQPSPVLLAVTRGGVVESRHRGSLVLLDESGAVSVALGSPDRVVFPRSSLKPMQTVAVLGAGFTGPVESVALASSSHSGEAMHRDGVRAILAAADLSEDALQCPPDLPAHRPSLIRWVAAGGLEARICHNCSGKHAAMLATCVVNGWDVGTYLDPAHPLQQAVRDEVERLCGARIVASSVDGCGAPAHAVQLAGLAAAFRALATAAPSAHAGQAAQAMRAHPLIVGGHGRAVTELTAEVDGLVAKDGAEGVWAAALPDGRAVALKVDDGAARALGPLLATVLRHWGYDGPAVRRWADEPILGGGRPIGTIAASPELRERLGL